MKSIGRDRYLSKDTERRLYSSPGTERLENSSLVQSMCKWFPRGLDDKKSAWNAGDLGLGRSPGEGNDNPLQHCCQENFMDREAQWATYSLWGHKESDMTEWLTPCEWVLVCLRIKNVLQ